MTGVSENRKSVSQDLPGEAVLARLSELATEFGAEHIASAARSIAERVSEGRFYVACVGQFKRGKSTLLNALIARPVLPTAVVPVTAVPTIIRHGESVAARVRFEDSPWVQIPVNAVEDYVAEEKNPENAKEVTGLEIFVPSPMLKAGMCLVDTPGLGSVFTGNTTATRAFIPHIDAAIIVIGSDPPVSADELQLVEAVSEQAHDLLFVLNKADRVNEVERAAAIQFAHKVLEKRLRREVPIFEVSALERLEGRGPARDWTELVQTLENLVLHSGRSLVREATERGIRRTSGQLLGVLKEERETLLRPLMESEQRIVRLRQALEEARGTMRDLGVLFTAEQQRLSEVFTERRNLFLKNEQMHAGKALSERLPSLAHRRNGPAYRRAVNHLAQDIAREQLTPWLEGEAKHAEEAFRKTARRFIELGNNFLRTLSETGVPGLEDLPEELDSEQGLRARSQFHFHLIERVAAPASPLLLISDLVFGALGLRRGILRDAQEFLVQLLEVNSSRVQSDVEDRVRETRRTLETEIKGILREASHIANRALSRARTAKEAGDQAVNSALVRIETVQLEIQNCLEPLSCPRDTSRAGAL
jgi:GTP-binding protein EngB required for normal cell division